MCLRLGGPFHNHHHATAVGAGPNVRPCRSGVEFVARLDNNGGVWKRREQFLPLVEAVGRVDNYQVDLGAGGFELSKISKRISSMDCGLSFELGRFEVLLDRPERSRRLVNNVGETRSTGQSFDRHRPSASKEVDHNGTLDQAKAVQRIECGFSHPTRGGPHIGALGSKESKTSGRPGNYAHRPTIDAGALMLTFGVGPPAD